MMSQMRRQLKPSQKPSVILVHPQLMSTVQTSCTYSGRMCASKEFLS